MQRFSNRVKHFFSENMDPVEIQQAIDAVQEAVDGVDTPPGKDEAKELAAEMNEADVGILEYHPSYDIILDELFSDAAEDLPTIADLKKSAQKSATAERRGLDPKPNDWDDHPLAKELGEITRTLKSHFKALYRGQDGAQMKLKRAERMYKKLQANFKGLVDAKRAAAYDVVSDWLEAYDDEIEVLERDRKRLDRISTVERMANGNRRRKAGKSTTEADMQELMSDLRDLVDTVKDPVKRDKALGSLMTTRRIFTDDEAEPAEA
jgi:hypothetical protein